MHVDPAQLDELFAAALEKTAPGDRAAFLDQATADNPELRERLDALIAAHAAAGSFLRLPPDDATAAFVALSERPGTVVGRYKLLEQIGEGGFGVVFMAEQEHPVRRRVALKVIKLGMDTKQVVARFEAERQALAMMDHPNIAKVFDAGATETGRPYFVMELVRGVPITTYCDESRLTTNERLVLFQSVCAAVQHAHQKGIIHRDLKPSNILVTLHDDAAVPKVIDFGVAKATQARLTERTLFTEFRQMIGTPSYMSPEQAQMSGLDADTRSDVYSLGVLLYELLTGTTPIDAAKLKNTNYDDLRRLICEVDPPSPSARLSTLSEAERTQLSERRQCDAHSLSLHLRSDLDWIVMKCLEKDRRRRYESASALAIDLERYLHGEPVAARPPTIRYRVGKYVARNRVAVIAAAATIAALVAGLGIASVGMIQAQRQARIAEIEVHRSQQVAQFLSDMLSAVKPGVARGRDTTLLREIVDKTAERVATDLQDQPEVQADLWATLASTYEALDDREKSVLLYQRAVDCYGSSDHQRNGEFALALSDLATNQEWLGEVEIGRNNAAKALDTARQLNDPLILVHCLKCAALTQGTGYGNLSGNQAEIPYLQEALEICRSHPVSPAEQAEVMALMGLCLTDEKDSEVALQLGLEALALYRKSKLDDDEIVARCHYYLGQIYARRADHKQAVAHLQAAVEIDRTIYPPKHSTILRPLDRLATSLIAVGRGDEAIDILGQVATHTESAFGPTDKRTLQSKLSFIIALRGVSRYADADNLSKIHVERSLEVYGNADVNTIEARLQRGYVLSGLHRMDEAAQSFEHVFDTALHTNNLSLQVLYVSTLDYSYTLQFLGRYEEASAAIQMAIAKIERSSRTDPRLPPLWIRAAKTKANVGDFEAARSCLDSALAACESRDWKNRSEIAWVLATSNFEQLRSGKRAIEIAIDSVNISQSKDASAIDTLAAAYAEVGDFAAAAKWEQKAVDVAPEASRFQTRLAAYRQNRKAVLGDPWILATSRDPRARDGKRALAIAKEGAKLTNYADAKSLAMLAVTYAENLDFESAVKWQERAVELANREQKARYQKYLEHFRNKRRWWVDE